MVFTTLTPERDTYLLWHRFRMPTRHGSKDAVAVESKVGNELIAAYAFMLEHIVLLVWSITVLAGLVILILMYANNETHAKQYPSKFLSKKIWRKRASPYSILKLAFRHFYMEESSRWLIIPWIFIAVAFIVVKYTVPIIFAPYISIGNAAPVNPEVVYFPSLNGSGQFTSEEIKLTVEQFELMVPSAQRAISNVNLISSKNTPISVSNKSLGIIEDGGMPVVNMQYEYGYTVTGLDLGLQNHPDLTLNVTGSCGIDYTWWNNSERLQGNVYADNYYFFNDPNNTQAVSPLDGGPTLAYFSVGNPGQTNPSTNITWGAIVSSLGRFSYSPGTDPWYLTSPLPAQMAATAGLLNGASQVLTIRPALSCWEDRVWFFRGHMGNINNLSMIHGLDLSQGVQKILFDNLDAPMIVQLGQYLGSASLNSSSTALSGIFDANSSTIFNDLQRLVYGSYIATVNIMTETTLFRHNGNEFSIINDLRMDSSSNSPLLPGVAEFVIFSNEIVTLDVRSLIVIPTVAMVLWILLLVLMFLPIPGKLVAKLSPSHQTESDLEKQEVHHVKSETSPKPATSKVQELEHTVSHGRVVSESKTEKTSESKRGASKVVEKTASFAADHSSEIIDVTENIVGDTKDTVSEAKQDFSDAEGDKGAKSDGGASIDSDADNI